MAHIGWGMEVFGKKNHHKGENDAYLCYMVVLGVPVYFSFRQAIHVIEILPTGDRLQRISSFAKGHLGGYRFAGAPAGICIPLRPLWSLKWRVLQGAFLWAVGILAFMAVIVALALVNSGR